VLEALLGDEELRSSVQSKYLIEHLLRDVFLVGETFHSSVVDDDVQSSKVRHRRIEQLGNFAGFADVGLNSNGAAACTLDVGNDSKGGFSGAGVVEDD